jgi:septal ring factor EnvC (AmiA/AmiB activator)
MRFIIAFILCILSLPAFAQEVSPARHPSAQIELEKKETQARQKTLQADADKAKSELSDTQSELVNIAKKIKVNEERLSKLDARMKASQKEKEEIETRLKKDRASIGDLVLALERLDRTPPEAILARPGAPLETAQSAMLLQSILPNIYSRAESLKKDVSRLDAILSQLTRDQKDVKDTAMELSKRQDEMSGLLKKRKGLYAQTQTDLKQTEAALAEISSKSQNLKDLVARIEERERVAKEEERTRVAAARQDEPKKASLLSKLTPLPRAGSPQLPISGTIKLAYGSLDDFGAPSQGLKIEGRPSALVVAPMGGAVRYAGYFKNYGQIIIVEHQKDYHSLIAGLARIDTVVGQSVAAGEPVGILGKNGSDGGGPSLYYELRLKGQPINPSRKIAGL